MIGNKRLDEKGFLLLEAVASWLILVTCLMIYLPFLVQMLKTVQWESNEVEQARIGFEQVQKLSANEPINETWVTAGKTYNISVPDAKKGIRVYDKIQEWNIQMQSFVTSPFEP